MGQEATATAPLIARWDTFLAKIEATFVETMEDAEPALLEVMVDEDGGVVPFLQSVSAVKSQIQGLLGKVHVTWTEKVRPLLLEADPEETTWDELKESIKGSDLTDGAGTRIQRWETVLCGRAAEELHKRTLERARTSFRCTLCSADIEVTENLFRSHYIACPYCSGRNTYEPSSELREPLHFTADHLARYRALELHDELEAAHERCRLIRGPVPDEQIEDLRALHMAYHTKVLHERIAVVPDFEPTLEADLERRAREFEIKEYQLRCLPVPTSLFQ